MGRAWNNFILCGAILLSVLMMAIGCSGGSDSPAPHFSDNSGTPGISGNVTPGSGGNGDAVEGPPPMGIYPGAPLGTNPAYNTTPVSDLITTTKVEGSGVSSARTASAEDPVLWVAVSRHGEAPVPGKDSPPIYEGDMIDLHIRYQVFADELTISRTWTVERLGLNYIEPSVSHGEAGTYHATFPFIMIYGTVGTGPATFTGGIGAAKAASIVVPIYEWGTRDVQFLVEKLPVLPPIHYPETNPDELNDGEDHGSGCLPEWITVEYTNPEHTEVLVKSDKAISHVVLLFADGTTQKFEDLGEELELAFAGTGDYFGKEIVGIWVKAGCNCSGDGAGLGEYFDGYEITQVAKMAMAQFAWDDGSSQDYDYNDFVGRMNIAETRTESNELVKIHITAKALARGSSNFAEWQFNIGASFPYAQHVWVKVDRFHADGSAAYYQEVLHSVGGASFAVFSPTAEAFPGASSWNTVNCEAGSTYVDGDWAEILIVVWPPQPQDSYSPMPYDPELAVTYEPGGNPMFIPLWSDPGDFTGGYPPAFIVPDTFAWVLEEEAIENVYPEYLSEWLPWMTEQEGVEPDPAWWQFPPVDGSRYFRLSDFN